MTNANAVLNEAPLTSVTAAPAGLVIIYLTVTIPTVNFFKKTFIGFCAPHQHD